MWKTADVQDFGIDSSRKELNKRASRAKVNSLLHVNTPESRINLQKQLIL